MSVNQNSEGKDRLRDIGLFGGLGDEVLEQLADSLEVIVLEPGAVVFKEGDSGRETFVLLDGEIEVFETLEKFARDSRRASWTERLVGEMSILDVMPRSATVRSLSPSRILRITAHDLDGAVLA